MLLVDFLSDSGASFVYLQAYFFPLFQLRNMNLNNPVSELVCLLMWASVSICLITSLKEDRLPRWSSFSSHRRAWWEHLIVSSYTYITPTKAELDFSPCKQFQFHNDCSKDLKTSYIRILNEILQRLLFDRVLAFPHFHSIIWLLVSCAYI